LTILALLPGTGRSQNISASAGNEILRVCTDRNLYIAGEKIHFTVAVFGSPDFTEPSRVLYCELITPDGTRITEGKFLIENSSSQGCIGIPVETISGYYFLRSYTRVMRNAGPENYDYIRLKIVNPDLNDVLAPAEVQGNTKAPYGGVAVEDDELSCQVITDKNIYNTREEIKIKIDAGAMNTGGMKFSLAVVPELSSPEEDILYSEPGRLAGDFAYYPDTRGISLSGRLTEEGTGMAVANAIVNLSVIGDKDVMAIRTDSSGRFFFALPDNTGSHDIFLCSEEIPGRATEIFIDNDFCTLPVQLSAPGFSIAPEESEAVLRIVKNHKVTSVFYPDYAKTNPDTTTGQVPFYGKPDEVLVMDKYIDLPTMEEYFQELVGAVNVRKYEGRKIFRFNSTRAEMTIFNPLVLIDWVAVDDIERILAMTPADIEKIELVNAPYIKGSITYGGIISFVSKKNDYAGIDLPASGTFIHYQFLEACREGVITGPFPGNLPDPRNTLYWDPDLRFNEGGKAEILITAPDTPGRYVIVLSGLGSKGIRTAREVVEIGDRR
jgi:hypothetical protein